MSVRFKVVIPSYNSVKWIKKTLDSVARQTYSHYDVCVIDDASTEAGQREIIESYCQKHPWQPLFRTTNHGALANIVEGIKQLNPNDEDVILLLDGDDWLYNRHVFAKVAAAYREEAVNMTYGQFITYPRWQKGFCIPLPNPAAQSLDFREIPFVFSHLRTFKHKIWKHVREEDLQDESGRYFKTAWDLAILYPLLEMTGGKSCKFINEFLYVYNIDNPLNDCVAHAQLQAKTADFIRKKKRYPRLFDQQCEPHRPHWIQQARNTWITIYRKIVTPKVYSLATKKLFKVALSGIKK